MGGADTAVVGPKSIPSAVGTGILISGQVGEYSQDYKTGAPHVEVAFRFVYSCMMGLA